MVNTPVEIFYQGHNFLKLDKTMAQAVDIATSSYAMCHVVKGILTSAETAGEPASSVATGLVPEIATTLNFILNHPMMNTIPGYEDAGKFLDKLGKEAQLLGAGIRKTSPASITNWLSSSSDLARFHLFSETGLNWTPYVVSGDSLAKGAEWLESMKGIALPFYQESLEYQQTYYTTLPDPLPNSTYLAELLERVGRVVAESAFLNRWKVQKGRETPDTYAPEFSSSSELDSMIEAAQSRAKVVVEGSFRYSKEDGNAQFFLALRNRAEKEADLQVLRGLPTRASWPQLYARIVRDVLADPVHKAFYANALGVSSPAELEAVKGVRIVTTKIPDNDVVWGQLNEGLAVWQKGLSFDLDLSGIRGTLGSIKQGIAKAQNFSNSLQEDRKRVQGQALAWYKATKDLALAPIKDIAGGMQDLGQLGTMPEGITMKFILPQPVVGRANLTASITSSLSTLKASSPVFRQDSNVDIGAFMLVMYSKDPLGSILIWVLMTSIVFGYNFAASGTTAEERLNTLITVAKDAGLTVIAKQFEELVAQGKAPSVGEIQSAVGGFSNVWSLTESANNELFQWFDKIQEQGKKVADTGPKLMEAVSSAIASLNPTTAAGAAGATAGGVVPNAQLVGEKLKTDAVADLGTQDPFDTWYEIFSLKGLLGPIGKAVDTVLGAASTTLKEGSALLTTVASGADSVSDAYVNIATSALDATENATNVGLKTADSAINILDEALSSLSTPSFGALLVPPVQGGTEKLRFTLAQMINESPSRPEELDSPYGLIMPLLVVVASDVTGAARIAWEKTADLFKVVGGTLIDPETGEMKDVADVLQGTATGSAIENVQNLTQG